MVRITILVAVLLVISALGLVTSQHRARKQFVELERVQTQARALEVQWNQLVLEQSELTRSALIDSKARRSLAMQPVRAERTLHLNLDDQAAKSAALRKR